MKKLCTVLLLLCIATIQAQNCTATLSGTITDFHDGTPLYSAFVQVAGTDIETYTDFDGHFKLINVCEGTFELQISHPECDTKLVEVIVKGNTIKNIKLEHHLDQLSEVVVSENASTTAKTNSASEAKLEEKDLTKYSSESLGTALKQISGVSSLNTGSTVVKPIIHGMHSSRVSIINNGVRLQDQEWGVEHAPNLDLNTAESITVVKGASALKYGGDAIGGTIIVDASKPIAKDSLYGRTIVSGATNGRGGSITSTLNKTYTSGLYFKGQGTYKRFGDYEAPNYMLSNTGVNEKDFSLGVGLRKWDYGFNAFYSYYSSEIGILRASHIGSVSDLADALESNTPNVINDFTYDINAPKQQVVHHVFKTDFYKRFSNLGKLNVQYSYQNNQRKEYDIRRGDVRDTPAMDMVLQTHTFSSDLAIDAVKNFKLDVGVTGSYLKNVPNPDTGVRRLIPDYTQTNLGVYATAEHQLGERMVLDAGIRYDYNHIDAQKYYLKSRWEERGYDEDFADLIIGDYNNQWLTNPVYNFHNFSATIGSKWYLNNYTARINASMATRAPNPSELFSDGLHHSAAIIELGDLHIEQEKSYKLSTELAYQNNLVNFSVNPYVNYINNYIVLQPTGLEQTTRGAFPVWEYSQTNALFAGIDVDANVAITATSNFKTSFAYVYAQDVTNNRAVIDIPSANWSNTFSYTVPKWNNIEFNLSNENVFTQTRFPDNDFTVNITNTSGEVEERTIALSTPPKGYQLFHFNTNATFKFIKRSTLNVGVSVDNIFNTNYRNYLNRQRYYADDLGRNFKIQLIFNY